MAGNIRLNPATVPIDTIVINTPATKARIKQQAIISSPALGILPKKNPSRNMHSPRKRHIPMGANGALSKLINFLVLYRIASVMPGFSPCANCKAEIRQIAPPAIAIDSAENWLPLQPDKHYIYSL